MKLMTLAAAALLCAATSQAAPFTIKGNIKGLTPGDTLALADIVHHPVPDIATAVVGAEGEFTFTGDVDSPRGVRLYHPGGYGHMVLMVGDPDVVTLNGTATSSADSDGKTTYNFDQVQVIGSSLTDRFLTLYRPRAEADKAHGEFERKYAACIQARQQGVATKDIPGYEEMVQAEKDFFTNLETGCKKVWDENKDSFWGPLMVFAFLNYTTPEYRAYWESLSDEAKNSYYGKALKDDLWPLQALGNVGDAGLHDQGGNTITLADLAKGKKYVLVDFWASWCRPCRKEIPNIKNIYAENADKGLQVVSISIDKEPEAWKKVSAIENLPWPSFLDDGTLAQRFRISSVPTLLIMDPEGNIVSDGKRGEELAAQIRELLN